MNPDGHDGTISAELEKSCAQEPIHLLGTVQSYGFLMVVDVASRCIAQVSAGIVRHWPGLDDASVLLSHAAVDWVAGVEGATDAIDVASLPASHSVALRWRPAVRTDERHARAGGRVALGMPRPPLRQDGAARMAAHGRRRR